MILYLRRAALMLLFALFTTSMAWAQNEVRNHSNTHGESDEDLFIYTEEDWNAFAAAVANGTTFYDRRVLLYADLDISTMVGTADHPFCGQFYGGGRVLTIRFGSEALPLTEEYVAPFRYVSSTEGHETFIEGLTVVGYIYTSSKYAAGLVAQISSDFGHESICTIHDCVSSVVIHSSVNGDGTHGGFVAQNASEWLKLSDCRFDGKLLTTNGTTKCGGFVGWNQTGTGRSIYLDRCLYAPATILSGETEISSETYNFIRQNYNEDAMRKCYYFRKFGTNDQGEQADDDESLLYAFSEEEPFNPGHYVTYWGIYGGKVEPGGAWAFGFSGQYGTEDDPFLLQNILDWEVLSNWSKKGAVGYYYKLTQDIDNITTMVGSEFYPFNGTFDGNDHTLKINIADTKCRGTAPFCEIQGATIKNLTVEGAVRGTTHAAGLVGMSHWAAEGNIIDNCRVSVHVVNPSESGSRHIGGIVGHGMASKLTIKNSVFDGTLSNTGSYAGGLQGWSDSNTLTIENCISTATYVGSGQGGFHPVAIKNAGSAVTLVADGCYYTADPTLTNTDYIAEAGTKASATAPTDIIYKTVTVKGVTVYVEQGPLHIAGHGNNTSSGGWHFIASPIKGSVNPTTIPGLIGNPSQYDLYRFNQSADLEWQNYAQHSNDFAITNGQGYLYASLFDTNITFAGDFITKENQDVDLVYDANADLSGWNLVGNPFPTNAYINRSYYRMNLDGSDIIPIERFWLFDIPACMGVMVQAENAEDNKVTFSKTAPRPIGEGGLLLTLTKIDTCGEVEQDRAIVSFNENIQLGKFIFNEEHAKIFIPQNGKDYAIACSEKTGEMPLSFKAVYDGEYTISADPVIAQMEYLHLIDNQMGTDVDLLTAPVYRFTVNAGEYASRFRLVFTANSVFENDDNHSVPFAYVNNGEIHLVVETCHGASLQVIDVLGRVIRSTTDVHAFSTANMPAGVYVLRLIDGNDVRTQKIMVK